MNAAPRSTVRQRRRSQRPATRLRAVEAHQASPSNPTRIPPQAFESKVERLHLSSPKSPLWLRSLLFVQRSSDVITFCLVAITLTVYSWTVYTQQQWSQEYRKLETLQRHERHLTTTNETLKDQLAQQAENPETGLVTPTTANTIYLPPARQETQAAPTPPLPETQPTTSMPLGY